MKSKNKNVVKDDNKKDAAILNEMEKLKKQI